MITWSVDEKPIPLSRVVQAELFADELGRRPRAAVEVAKDDDRGLLGEVARQHRGDAGVAAVVSDREDLAVLDS